MICLLSFVTKQASQPFFNVILAYLIYRSKFTLATYLSLVPIVLGVVLASVSEMGMNVRIEGTACSGFRMSQPSF